MHYTVVRRRLPRRETGVPPQGQPESGAPGPAPAVDERAVGALERRVGSPKEPIALVHDYLTQRGGAERVVLSLTRAFPGAPVYTSLHQAAGTFPEFEDVDVRAMAFGRIPPFRHDHRFALPLLARAFGRLVVDADVVVCSSSGWAHGVATTGRKIIYCHNPARWLHQQDQYFERTRSVIPRLTARVLAPPLRRWDARAAATADLYVANSAAVQERIRRTYGIRAEVIHPPHAAQPDAPRQPVAGIEPGFFLSVSRLVPHKNVGVVAEAFRSLPGERLVVAGTGPQARALQADAPANARFVGAVPDAQLRWLYANCAALVVAAHEDYGLTPLEAAAFGKPVVALRWGGYLETVAEGRTGVFFDELTTEQIVAGVRDAEAHTWDADAIIEHADTFSEARFIERIRALVTSQA